MTMQQTHSPKPEIFGEGYGAHLAYNYRLMKKFFWLGWKMMIHMFIPAAFYERAHWEVIELYHKMRGFRHGTISDHRCPDCGSELYSADETHCRQNELKDLEQEREQTARCDNAMLGLNKEPETWGEVFATEHDGNEDNITLTNPARPIIAKYEIDIEDDSSDK